MTFGTMEKIETVTLTGSQSSITFSNIPSTYNDLLIKISARASNAGTEANCSLSFNGQTTSFSSRLLYGDGATAGSGTRSDNLNVFLVPASGATASTFGNAEIYIPNYAGSTNKSFSVDSVNENNGTTSYSQLSAGLRSNTDAITSISFSPQNSGSFVQHTTATLYGITRVPAGAKATGGVIYDDASYWYHVFTSSGTFTPSQNLTCDYLVVAGGGGGGNHHGGGGGAGGLRCTVSATGGGGALESALSLLANTNYTVTIGAGGAGSSSNAARGLSGSNSVFSTITSTGGGGGGSRLTEQSGASGGSGGGGGYTGAGGVASPSGQGYAGAGDTAPVGAGGGGGGAGAVGSAPTSSSAAGNGGNGITTVVSGTSTVYAGGGGGGSQGGTAGTGGNGGGGAGSTSSVNATSGTTNTGGGGGGNGYSGGGGSGGNGGSGIVIVRYAK